MGCKKTISAGGVVISPQGQVLLISQHGIDWTLPKGHVDDGESLLQAAEREIYEESGVSGLEMIKELGSYQRYRIGKHGEDDKSELKTINMFLFKTNNCNDQLCPVDPENPAAEWVNLNEAPDKISIRQDKEFFLSIVNQIKQYLGV